MPPGRSRSILEAWKARHCVIPPHVRRPCPGAAPVVAQLARDVTSDAGSPKPSRSSPPPHEVALKAIEDLSPTAFADPIPNDKLITVLGREAPDRPSVRDDVLLGAVRHRRLIRAGPDQRGLRRLAHLDAEMCMAMMGWRGQRRDARCLPREGDQKPFSRRRQPAVATGILVNTRPPDFTMRDSTRSARTSMSCLEDATASSSPSSTRHA